MTLELLWFLDLAGQPQLSRLLGQLHAVFADGNVLSSQLLDAHVAEEAIVAFPCLLILAIWLALPVKTTHTHAKFDP
ncbi:MAG: hypothetical protein IPI49_14910 [Myxococcales bacterium]|nr:hypothetical protein [Myxococcales bacterium]